MEKGRLQQGERGALVGQSKVGVEGGSSRDARSGHNVIAGVDGELVGKTI